MLLRLQKEEEAISCKIQEFRTGGLRLITKLETTYEDLVAHENSKVQSQLSLLRPIYNSHAHRLDEAYDRVSAKLDTPKFEDLVERRQASILTALAGYQKEQG